VTLKRQLFRVVTKSGAATV